ncbi:unnamed protein product [Cylicostephanus goldi]|uniref:C3H1-type domain-containing protein n=1 Tax=Cylicostephanus goldi TaxID=71465 RepID=A0A3P7QGH7_CYLGO|nr:unnamed protein product [Cylicostephanus goldi]
MCHKGAKCKFSHDLAVEQKTQKKNLYVDSRELKQEEDNMENWDETKLSEVVNKKHGEANKKLNQTTIVCKYFLQAVEENKYGWFWECPNGGDKCIYRHCLPEGYVLKKDRKKMEEQDKENQISLEELIEKEVSCIRRFAVKNRGRSVIVRAAHLLFYFQRAALQGKNLTKVTLQSFVAWKKRKLREKKQKEEEEEKAKKDKIKAGRAVSQLFCSFTKIPFSSPGCYFFTSFYLQYEPASCYTN